jgi:hypothetical protein
MKEDTYRKIALLHEIAKQNRIIELRLKMMKTLHPQMRKQFEKMIQNLSK